MFLSAAEEFEREGRQQATYGESPDWIRRVLQAYTRTEEYRWRVLLRQAARGSRADIPLGTPVSVRSTQQPTVSGVPQLVTTTTRRPISTIPTTARIQPTTSVQTVIPAQSITETTAMDLGNILSGLGQAVDIYGQYRRIRSGQFPVMGTGGTRLPQGVIVDDFGVDMQRNVAMPALLPALPAVIGGAASQGGRIAAAIAGLGIGLNAEEIAAIAGVASKVKCRRRRRRLATHSDIKDLAALKAVLGSGKAFDTWIATRKM